MKILLIAILVALCAAQGPRTANVFTGEEIEKNKNFIACYNLARYMSMRKYSDIKQIENQFNAGSQEGAYRYMLEVTHKCKRHATEAQKDSLVELFKNGEDYPELPEFSSDIIPDLNQLIKSVEDFKVPADYSETVDEVNTLGIKFSDSLDQMKVQRQKEAQKEQSSINIMGVNINKISTSTKTAYVIILVAVLGFFFILAARVLLREKTYNPKHMPENRRRRADRKKAKTS